MSEVEKKWDDQQVRDPLLRYLFNLKKTDENKVYPNSNFDGIFQHFDACPAGALGRYRDRFPRNP
jgi:hypothetical protein